MIKTAPLLGDDGELLHDMPDGVVLLEDYSTPEERFDALLRKIFGFTAADLDANRAGRLTESQLERIQTRYKLLVRTFVWVLLLGVVVLIVGAVTGRAVWLIVGGCIPLVVLVFGIPWIAPIHADATDPRVLQARGALIVQRTLFSNRPAYWIRVDGTRFRVSYLQFQMLKQFRKHPVIVYYTRSGDILSTHVEYRVAQRTNALAWIAHRFLGSTRGKKGA